MRCVEVLIAGNGVVAHTTARALLRRDRNCSLAIIGPSNRAGGGSQAAGAMLGSFGEVTKYTFASKPALAKFALSREADLLWPGLLAELDATSPGRSLCQTAWNTFVILNGRSGVLDSDNFRALREALYSTNQPFEDVDEVPGLNPSPDARPLRAIHLPGEGAVDPRIVLDRLELVNRRAGADIVDARVSGVTRCQSTFRVTLDNGDLLETPNVVVALGAFGGPVLDGVLESHEVQPILAGSGMAYLAERVMGMGFEAVVRSVNRSGSCGLHVVPRPDGLEYIGATNVIYADPELRPHLGLVHFLAACAMDQLDTELCYSRVEEIRIGNRPIALDGYPLLGTTSVPGLVVLTGTYRDGFQCAPRIAELAADTVVAGKSAFPVEFDPSRPPHEFGTVRESIDEFALHSVSSAYENGTRLSPFMSHRDIAEHYRSLASAMYERLGTDVGLPPDTVAYLTTMRKRDADVNVVASYLSHH